MKLVVKELNDFGNLKQFLILAVTLKNNPAEADRIIMPNDGFGQILLKKSVFFSRAKPFAF